MGSVSVLALAIVDNTESIAFEVMLYSRTGATDGHTRQA